MLCIGSAGVPPARRRTEKRENLLNSFREFDRRNRQVKDQIMLIVTVTHLPVGIVVTNLMTYGASFVTQKILWLLLA